MAQSLALARLLTAHHVHHVRHVHHGRMILTGYRGSCNGRRARVQSARYRQNTDPAHAGRHPRPVPPSTGRRLRASGQYPPRLAPSVHREAEMDTCEHTDSR